MRGRALALGAALVLMSALGAQAQDDDDEDDYEYYFAKESSGYVELYGAGGYFIIDGDNKGSGGVGITAGGHILEWLAMDVTYEYQSDDDTHLASYALKWVVLPESRVTPYFKAGLGIMGGRPQASFLFMGRFDAGVQIFLDEQLAVTTGVGYAVGARDNNNLLLGKVGLAYYFE